MNTLTLSRQRGFTLIELMVAIVIASLLMIAISSVMIGFESRKRSNTAVNDVNQAGNFAVYMLDNWLRSAGSGFSQSAEYAFGCALQASNGSQVLPRTTTLPSPFASVGTSFRLAPALIISEGSTPGASGRGSDVLLVMSGAAGRAEAPVYLTDYPSAASIAVKNTLAFAANDLLLMTDQESSSSGIAPCLISQVSSSFTESGASSLTLAGTYYASTVNATSVAGFTKNAVIFDMGNVVASNPPAFQVIGVGDNNTLYAYDLLQTTTTPLQSVANDVFELHALYGLDTSGDGKIDSWVKPTGSYSFSTLSDGSSTANGVISTIKAVRVGLILRTSLPEKTAVSASALSLFSDLGSSLQFTRSLSTAEQKYRYRTLEISVPLRNAMMLE